MVDGERLRSSEGRGGVGRGGGGCVAAQQQRLLMLVAVEELDDAMLYVSLLRNCRVDVMIRDVVYHTQKLAKLLKKN